MKPTPKELHQFLTCRIELKDKLDLVNGIRTAAVSATDSKGEPPRSPTGSIPLPGQRRTRDLTHGVAPVVPVHEMVDGAGFSSAWLAGYEGNPALNPNIDQY